MALLCLFQRPNNATSSLLKCGTAVVLCVVSLRPVDAQSAKKVATDKLPSKRIIAPPNRNVLPDEQWKKIEAAVDRGVAFIAASQLPNGSFAADDRAEPGVTALCVLALLGAGHKPGSGDSGPHAQTLERAIDYVLSTQRKDGMLSVRKKETHPEYNHGIAAFMLAEVYGLTLGEQHLRIDKAISLAIKQTRIMQAKRKHYIRDFGGWRYDLKNMVNDADLTVSTWHLMFYHSAKNAGFEIPDVYFEQAMGYVHRSFDPEKNAFVYTLAAEGKRYCTGGSVGGGVIALALAHELRKKPADACGDWILDNPFNRYNRRRHPHDRYHYAACLCSWAMFQIEGKQWEEFYPRLQRVLLDNQREDGSWELEENQIEVDAGYAYTTALSVLALTPPYQNLPLFRNAKLKRSEESENPAEPSKKNDAKPKPQ